MNTVMVIPENAEQLQVIEAFLNALKIKFVLTSPASATHEGTLSLSPEQIQIASNLENGLQWVERYHKGDIPKEEILTLDELLNQHENAVL